MITSKFRESSYGLTIICTDIIDVSKHDVYVLNNISSDRFWITPSNKLLIHFVVFP